MRTRTPSVAHGRDASAVPRIGHESTGGLAIQALGALKWNYFGNGIRALSQLLIGIVLARLLGPEAFGTVAIAWLMLGIGMLIADLGFGAALVQRESVTEQDINFVFTLQVALGATLSLVGVAAAGAVARFFQRPDAAPVIRAMALLFVFQSFGQTPLSLLRRSLDFKAAQTITVAAYLASFVLIGIPCAYRGMGAWSLVVAQLAQSSLASALAMNRCRTRFRPAVRPTSPELFAFGGKVIGSNLLSWSISNVDSAIVGRVLGITDLGLYSRAMSLVSAPSAAVTTGLQGVLFAACSRAQTNTVLLKRAFLGATMAVGAICLPAFFAVAMVSGTVIAGTYGPKWAAATPLLVPLALAMSFGALLALVGPVLTAVNRVTIELKVQGVTLVCLIPVLYFTARHSFLAVAWGMLAIYFLRWLLLVTALIGVLEATWADMFKALAWPVLLALIAAGAAASCDALFGALPPTPRLALDIAAALIGILCAGTVLGKRMLGGSHGAWLLQDDRLPGAVRRWLRV